MNDDDDDDDDDELQSSTFFLELKMLYTHDDIPQCLGSGAFLVIQAHPEDVPQQVCFVLYIFGWYEAGWTKSDKCALASILLQPGKLPKITNLKLYIFVWGFESCEKHKISQTEVLSDLEDKNKWPHKM